MNDQTIIAFDCFDTLVHRDCHPEVILFYWARIISAKLSFSILPDKLYKSRKNIERKLLEINEDNTYDTLMGDIYDNFFNNEEKFLSKEEFIKLAYDVEQKLELDHTYLDEENVTYLKKMYSLGKKIIVISDFYLPKKFFDQLFSKLGIGRYIDEVFVSSDLGRRKSTGNLYKHIIKKYGIKFSDMLMVGDNRNSDYIIPSRLGILVKHIPYTNKREINSIEEIKKIILKETISKKDSIFNGYVGALYLFCEKLYYIAKKHNIQTLMFCAREGQNLKKLFDCYQKYLFPEEIVNTKYLYVSRQATLLPSLKDLTSENFERIFRQYNELITKDFLLSIGLSPNEIEKISDSGIDLNEIISSNNNQMSLLKGNDLFREIYNQKRIHQRKLFLKYIYDLNLGETKEVNIVDIGWKGTIQDNIYSIIGEKTKVHGYYFGLFSYDSNLRNTKRGIIFDQSLNSIFYDIYSYNYVDLEKVFAADHGQTLFYQMNGNNVVPILSNDETDVEIFKYVRNWQRKMYESFVLVCKAFSNSIVLAESVQSIITRSYLREQCLYRSRYDELYLKFRKKAKENFGNISGIKIKPEKNVFRDKNMQKKYLYTNYSFRILKNMHLKVLYPFAKLYCVIVYIVKNIELRV